MNTRLVVGQKWPLKMDTKDTGNAPHARILHSGNCPLIVLPCGSDKRRHNVGRATLPRALRDTAKGQRIGLDGRLFLFGDGRKISGESLPIHPFQIKSLTAGQDRSRNFMHIGRRQQELRMRWRLFQRFEQRVEGVFGEHVHFVEDVHLGPTRVAEVDLLEQIAHVLDPVVRRSIELVEVERLSLFDVDAAGAGAAGLAAIQWDVVSGDPWTGASADAIAQTVKTRVKPGSIVVMHANGRGWHTGKALPLFIGALRKQGYEFVTVSQLLAAGRPVAVAACYETKPGDNLRYDKLFGKGTGD